MITKKIVEQYDGDIILKSDLGKGTTIKIIFKFNGQESDRSQIYKDADLIDYKF
jgi:signal transduction histidine kinase